ncbi:MAG: hypothetical protein V3S29_14525 [bacterium]
MSLMSTRSSALLLAVLVFLALPAAALSARRPKSRAEPRPLRLGLIHPRPRLCLGQEPAQKDLRILRIAFGLGPDLAGARGFPWYFTEGPGPGQSAGLGLAVDGEGLWPAQGDAPGASGPGSDRFLDWRATVLRNAALHGISPPGASGSTPSRSPGRAPAELAIQLPREAGPFFASRLWGSGLLPFRAKNEWRDGAAPCRDWPSWVEWPKGAGRGYVYRLLRRKNGRHPPLAIFAYKSAASLWRGFRAGRLDALLLEGGEWLAAVEKVAGRGRMAAATVGGSQQLTLRLSATVRTRLGGPGVLALSRAVDRRRLAGEAGPGFVPLRAFLHPLVRPPEQGGENPLLWNSLRAREVWMGEPLLPKRFTLAVLDHPLLVRVGRALAGQWRKTLNLSVAVRVLPVDRFVSASAGADGVLEVADLDDGSLQDLWQKAIAGGSRPVLPPLSAGLLAEWETALQRELPYLPLLGNRHFVLARGPRAARTLARVCPGCSRLPPAELRPRARSLR